MPGPSARRRPAAHADAAGPPAAPSRIDSGLDPEQTMAVLSSVLDDLGAAHHRPFSRQ